MHISKELKEEARLMRRDATARYKNEKRELWEKYQWEINSFYEKCGISRPKDPPKRSTSEEICNAISHGLGAFLSLFALFAMLSHSKTASQRTGAVVYFLGLFTMFLSSCLYHSFKHGTLAKRVFRRFDYASVYFLIGATLCPIILNYSFSGNSAKTLLAVRWTVISIGALAALVLGPAKFVYPHISLYLILGWSALLVIPSVASTDSGFLLPILLGGVLYTLGVIPCAIDKRASHFVWHVFVLCGATVQCLGVLNYIYLS